MTQTIVMPAAPEIIGAWIAAGLTLIMFSFLYRDNPLFKLGEHLYVGLSAGYGLCYAWFNVVWPDLIEPLYRATIVTFGGKLDKPLERYETMWLVIPLIFSILMLTRFFPKIAWLSRWSFAFIMGSVSGMAIPLVVSADIFKQMVPTLQPIWQPGATGWETFSQTSGGVVILVGVIAVLIYFFFSMEHKGTVKTVARLGVLYMMVSFGAAFGYTVMGRETLAISRFQDLVKWGKEPYYYASIILFFTIALLVALIVIISKLSGKPESTE